jgi:hypothetical protein
MILNWLARLPANGLTSVWFEANGYNQKIRNSTFMSSRNMNVALKG